MGKFPKFPGLENIFPKGLHKPPLAVIVKEENRMMNDKVSRLGVLFIIVGFFMLCVSYVIDNFTYNESEYILPLGWYCIMTGMLILAVMGVFYILKMLYNRFKK